MNNPTLIMFGPELVSLGWALIHFLWQGALIAIVLEIALGLVGRKNASIRYLLCGAALSLMPVCLAGTYWVLSPGSASIHVQQIATTAPANGHSTAPSMSSQVTLWPAISKITESTSRVIPALDLNRWMPGIVAGWLIGVAILAGRKAGGFVVLWRLRRRGVSTPSDDVSELFRRACEKIGIDSRRVCLKISSLVLAPMTMGWIKPVVLFPAALLSGLSTDEIELLLAHELAHIRRCDYLANLLQNVVETIFFYHPVTWWISHRMRQERENCCDDLVASSPKERLAYAKTLLQLESIRLPSMPLASAANGGSLLQRIVRLTGAPATGPDLVLPSLFVLLSILGASAAVSVVKAQDAPPAKLKDIPVAQPVPAKPEAVFAEPITMKEMPPAGPGVTRLYYQGGNLILQQCLNASPGSVGQLVFYKHTVVVDDRGGSMPFPYSSRFVPSNDFKITVQSISADSISPASLRILDSSQQIITEFFIDKAGVMRPITQAEHDTDLARRKAALDKPGAAPAPPAPTAPTTATQPGSGGIVATVNQHSITSVEVDQQVADTVKLLGQNFSGDELKQKIADARRNVVHALIDRWLIIDDFKALGGFIPDKYTNERIDDVVKADYGGDRNEFLKTIAARRVTLEKYKEEIENNAIVGYMRNKNVSAKVFQYYQDHTDLFPQDEQINATFILIPGDDKTGKTIDDHEHNPKYVEAQQVLDQVRRGADFSVLADEYVKKSNNGFFDHGPTLWLTKDGGFTDLLLNTATGWQALEKIQPGQTSGIIDGNWFYAIARVNIHHAATSAAPVDPSKSRATILNLEAQRLQEEWLGGLRAKAKIQRFDDAATKSNETFNQVIGNGRQIALDQPIWGIDEE